LNAAMKLTIYVPVLVFVAMSGCALGPQKGSPIGDFEHGKAEQARAGLLDDERLAPFFEQSKIIAVYPTNVRAGVGFGGAYGYGLLYKDGEIIGRSRMYQVSVGANLGAQVYRQILFFKTEQAFERLMAGLMEFAGQANVAVGALGMSSTPSFNTEVALFTQLRSGLLIEGSVGAHRYAYWPAQQSLD